MAGAQRDHHYGRHPQKERRQRKTFRGGSAAGMRLLASAVFAAMALSRVADSEALPAKPHALLVRPPCGSGGHAPQGCRGPGAPASGRGEGLMNRQAFSGLRGGFSWGAPEQAPTRRGASGMFGAAWGSGSPDSNGNGNDADENRSRRVDTRGPPDLNSRLPPTAPGSDGGSSGFFGGGGGGGGGSARERVRTVGPPDAGGGGGESRRKRRGLFSSPTVPENQQQQQQQGAGRFESGGRADPFWAGARPKMGFGGGRTATTGGDDGEGGAPVRGWREGRGFDSSDGRGLMAVHYLVLSCFGLFSLNTLFGFDRAFGLSLNHHRPRWWQSVTSLLLHGDQHHLMGNMFNLMIFGKMAEEDMGSVGMLISFVACGVASSFVSLMIMPRNISSCGASGAIFGLYSVSVLGKMFNLGRRGSADGRLRKLVEAAVFGWFVVESVMSEMRMVVAGGVTGIDHAAHFGGVFAGAVLILMFRRSFREQRGRERTLLERSA